MPLPHFTDHIAEKTKTLFSARLPLQVRVTASCALLILSVMLSFGSRASDNAIHINAAFERVSASLHSEYLRAAGAQLELGDILQLPAHQWTATNSEAPFFGYSPDQLWVRFEVLNENHQKHHLLLELPYPLLDQVEVYLLQNSSVIQHYVTGDQVPFQQRPVDATHFVFPINLEAGARNSVYVKVSTSSALGAPLTLWSSEHFFDHQQAPLMIQGLYFGIILVMLLYNLFLFASIRHISYLYYIGAVLGCATYVASVLGFGFQFLWPHTPWVNTFAVPASLALFGLMGTLFATSLLNVRDRSPNMYKLLVVLACCFLCVLILSFILPYRYATIAVSLLGMPTTLIVIGCGFVMLRRGVRTARFFVLAWTILLSSVFITGLSKFGLLPSHPLITYSIPLASAIEVLLFSIALADRIIEIREQTFAAQKTALEKEKIAREEHQRFLELKFRSERGELAAKKTLLEAKEDNRAKSEFLTMMSHEIRTPLNGVLGMVDLMRDSELDDNQRHFLSAITHSGASLLGIIDDILDYSNIVAGKLKLKTSNTDLQLLCQECITVFSSNRERQHLKLFCSFASGTPDCIQADPARLNQVLFNLLGNAFKFTQKGHVFLQVSCDNQSAADRVRLRFDVIDTGPGIPPKNQQKLFNAFSQADTSINREFGGTGLGLSICKKLVELMGGKIGVISVPGQGSRFWFSIDCQRADNDFLQQHKLQADDLKNKTVLLISETPIALQILSDQTSSVGMLAEVAHNTDNAIEIVKSDRKHFNFVVFDLDANNPASLDQIRSLKQLEPLRNTHFVILSTPVLLPDSVTLQTLGVDTVLQKPFAPKYFLQTLSQTLLNASRHPLYAGSAKSDHADTDEFPHCHILVVEDNVVNQMVISGLLKKLAVHFRIVENGASAVDYVTQSGATIDLILMDCEMPVMDGFAATSAIREYESKQKLSPIPIIALSAHVLPEHQEKAFAAGMNDHIAKPIDFAVLRRKLSRHL